MPLWWWAADLICWFWPCCCGVPCPVLLCSPCRAVLCYVLLLLWCCVVWWCGVRSASCALVLSISDSNQSNKRISRNSTNEFRKSFLLRKARKNVETRTEILRLSPKKAGGHGSSVRSNVTF